MTECRLVVHDGTIEKCKRLGLIENEKFTLREAGGPYPFLMIQKDNNGDFTYNNFPIYDYCKSDLPEVKSEDFLALPEPIVVGDWVKCELKNWIRIVKIERMNKYYGFVDTHGIAYELDICTKLTPEQIEVLGL